MNSPAPPPVLLLIVPTLDSHRLLPRLVASLQAQSWPRWRVLFIDGPSGLAHRQALKAICAADSRFAWRPQHPSEPGIYGAMNQGFAAAGPADWLLFWGSDDWAAAPDVLERAASALVAGPASDLLVCRGRYVARGDPEGSGLDRPGRPARFACAPCAAGPAYRRALFRGSTPPHQATLIGPGARARLARYDLDLRLAADLDYFLRLSRREDLRVRVLDLELVAMGEGGVSGVEHRRRLAEVRRAYRRAFGALWPLPFLLRYLRRLVQAGPMKRHT